MEPQILQWIGYLASGIITLSMTMNSIVKFRWINLVGALIFAIYGLLIAAFPVMLLNGIIVLVDVYYLQKIYTQKQLFDIVEIKPDSRYLVKFLAFHKKEIERLFPEFEYNPKVDTVSFFILRNTMVTGLFLAHRESDNILKVSLDYVIPAYRDYKNGNYVYNFLKNEFVEKGFKTLMSETSNARHSKYLKKMGFRKDSNGYLIKEL